MAAEEENEEYKFEDGILVPRDENTAFYSPTSTVYGGAVAAALRPTAAGEDEIAAAAGVVASGKTGEAEEVFSSFSFSPPSSPLRRRQSRRFAAVANNATATTTNAIAPQTKATSHHRDQPLHHAVSNGIAATATNTINNNTNNNNNGNIPVRGVDFGAVSAERLGLGGVSISGSGGGANGSGGMGAAGGTAALSQLLAPVLTALQSMQVWATTITFPSLFGDYFSGFLSFLSLGFLDTAMAAASDAASSAADGARALVEAMPAAVLAVVLQAAIVLAVMAAVVYFLIDDDRSFSAFMGRYVWQVARVSAATEHLSSSLAAASYPPSVAVHFSPDAAAPRIAIGEDMAGGKSEMERHPSASHSPLLAAVAASSSSVPPLRRPPSASVVASTHPFEVRCITAALSDARCATGGATNPCYGAHDDSDEDGNAIAGGVDDGGNALRNRVFLLPVSESIKIDLFLGRTQTPPKETDKKSEDDEATGRTNEASPAAAPLARTHIYAPVSDTAYMVTCLEETRPSTPTTNNTTEAETRAGSTAEEEKAKKATTKKRSLNDTVARPVLQINKAEGGEKALAALTAAGEKKEAVEDDDSDHKEVYYSPYVHMQSLGPSCPHHPSVRLSLLRQTEVWPFRHRPTCCVVVPEEEEEEEEETSVGEEEAEDTANVESRNSTYRPHRRRFRCCNTSEGRIFSCGASYVDPSSGAECVCTFAVCASHYRTNGPIDVVLALAAGLFRKLRPKSRDLCFAPLFYLNSGPRFAAKGSSGSSSSSSLSSSHSSASHVDGSGEGGGWSWLLCLVALALADAIYTPFVKTALMIVGCHPRYQCELEGCWDGILGGIVGGVTRTVRETLTSWVGGSSSSLSSNGGGDNANTSSSFAVSSSVVTTEALSPLSGISQPFALAVYASLAVITLLGIGYPLALFVVLRRRKRLIESAFEEGEVEREEKERPRKGARGNGASSFIGEQKTLTDESKENGLNAEGTPPATPQDAHTDVADAGRLVTRGKEEEAAAAVRLRHEWSLFVLADISALAGRYKDLQPRWVFFPAFAVALKVIAIIPAVFLEPRAFEQRLGVAIVTIFSAAFFSFFAAPRAFASPVTVLMYRASAVQQLCLLGLQNVALLADEAARERRAGRGIGWGAAHLSARLGGGSSYAVGGSSSSSSANFPLSAGLIGPIDLDTADFDPTSTAAYPATAVAPALMIAVTLLYLLFVVGTIAYTAVRPFLTTRLRSRRLARLLARHGLVSAASVGLYVDPLHRLPQPQAFAWEAEVRRIKAEAEAEAEAKAKALLNAEAKAKSAAKAEEEKERVCIGTIAASSAIAEPSSPSRLGSPHANPTGAEQTAHGPLAVAATASASEQRSAQHVFVDGNAEGNENGFEVDDGIVRIPPSKPSSLPASPDNHRYVAAAVAVSHNQRQNSRVQLDSAEAALRSRSRQSSPAVNRDAASARAIPPFASLQAADADGGAGDGDGCGALGVSMASSKSSSSSSSNGKEAVSKDAGDGAAAAAAASSYNDTAARSSNGSQGIGIGRPPPYAQSGASTAAPTSPVGAVGAFAGGWHRRHSLGGFGLHDGPMGDHLLAARRDPSDGREANTPAAVPTVALLFAGATPTTALHTFVPSHAAAPQQLQLVDTPPSASLLVVPSAGGLCAAAAGGGGGGYAVEEIDTGDDEICEERPSRRAGDAVFLGIPPSPSPPPPVSTTAAEGAFGLVAATGTISGSSLVMLPAPRPLSGGDGNGNEELTPMHPSAAAAAGGAAAITALHRRQAAAGAGGAAFAAFTPTSASASLSLEERGLLRGDFHRSRRSDGGVGVGVSGHPNGVPSLSVSSPAGYSHSLSLAVSQQQQQQQGMATASERGGSSSVAIGRAIDAFENAWWGAAVATFGGGLGNSSTSINNNNHSNNPPTYAGASGASLPNTEASASVMSISANVAGGLSLPSSEGVTVLSPSGSQPRPHHHQHPKPQHEQQRRHNFAPVPEQQ